MAGEEFKGLPMADLIGSPLQAACDAQMRLAASTIDFITKIGFQDGDTTKPNLLKFDLQRPVETPTGIETTTVQVQAPLLGLVPLPALLVDGVQIDFQMEVTATETTTTKEAKEGSVEANASFKIPFAGQGTVKVQGKVTSSRDNTRSTNQSAKYQVHVSARQQPAPEGLSRLMDILASCTAPLSVAAAAK